MTANLLVIAVGPVQEFIAAARRTRDLWFGSYLLSEISKSTAKAVHDHGGRLIFPAPAKSTELDPDSPINVANIILAELPESDPKAVADSARKAAESRWREFAEDVLRDNEGVIQIGIWREQVDDIIEFYASWMPLRGPDQYQSARAQLMRLLSGRKNCRDFKSAKGHPKVPKSSLDGLRESVLKDPAKERWPERYRRRLRVREGEQLDVVGLVKRTAGGHKPYPSVSRVAADPWVRGLLNSRGPDVLRPFLQTCRDLGEEVLHPLDTSIERGHPHYKAFPYEGTAFFRARHHELKEEAELSDAELELLTEALLGLIATAGEPKPYLAVLAADGDRMGQALSRLTSADEHRAFSQRLSLFAGEARKIVHEHQGVLVYSGGDDVLAFVPIDECLACARELHDKFSELMQSWTRQTGTDLTLSVGLALAHFLEHLEDLLEFGRAAEKHAKRPRPEDGQQSERDGLAVHLHKRGGAPVEVRSNWNNKPDELLGELAGHLKHGTIPGRVAYDLLRIADVYDDWPAETVTDAITRDTLRVISAKQPRAKSEMDRIRDLLRERVTDAHSLRRLGDELLVARQVAIAIQQAEGRPAPEVVSS